MPLHCISQLIVVIQFFNLPFLLLAVPFRYFHCCVIPIVINTVAAIIVAVIASHCHSHFFVIILAKVILDSFLLVPCGIPACSCCQC